MLNKKATYLTVAHPGERNITLGYPTGNMEQSNGEDIKFCCCFISWLLKQSKAHFMSYVVQSIRLVVRDLERTCREIYMLLQGVHHENGLNSGMILIYTSIDIGVSANLELVDKFCYLVDMLSVDGDAGATVEARIRIGWNKFRQLVPLLMNKDMSLIMRGSGGSRIWWLGGIVVVTCKVGGPNLHSSVGFETILKPLKTHLIKLTVYSHEG